MPKIDVTDEAVIDSSPIVVYKAILNELAGVTNWWMPTHESKVRKDMPIDRKGAIVDITIHRSGTPKFSYTLTKVVEAESIEMTIAGDFVGTGKWTFEPTADGKTKVQYRFNASTNRMLFSLVSPFVNIGKNHSDVMQTGFKACNSYLRKK